MTDKEGEAHRGHGLRGCSLGKTPVDTFANKTIQIERLALAPACVHLGFN
jgi:hypothetical protein